MYDDKKYSPCYSGYRDDFLFVQLCDLQQKRDNSQYLVVDMSFLHNNLYRSLTGTLAS